MGLYPPGTGEVSQFKASLDSEKLMPPMKIRQSTMSKQSESGGLMYGYVQIPIFNFMEHNINDFEDCPYADSQNAYTWKNHPEIFNDLSLEILPIVRKPIGKSQNYTND